MMTLLTPVRIEQTDSRLIDENRKAFFGSDYFSMILKSKSRSGFLSFLMQTVKMPTTTTKNA